MCGERPGSKHIQPTQQHALRAKPLGGVTAYLRTALAADSGARHRLFFGSLKIASNHFYREFALRLRTLCSPRGQPANGAESLNVRFHCVRTKTKWRN